MTLLKSHIDELTGQGYTLVEHEERSKLTLTKHEDDRAFSVLLYPQKDDVIRRYHAELTTGSGESMVILMGGNDMSAPQFEELVKKMHKYAV